MSWLPFRGPRKDKEPAARAVAAQAEAEPEVHRSLALPALFDAMSRSPKVNVLDLGSAVGTNVEYLSRFGCRLSIEDLFASRSAAAEEGDLGPDFFARLLTVPEGTQFDIVLAWDLYNYLSRKELRHLAAALRRLCRPGALVFSLMWIHKTIPAQPIRFRIQGPDQLLYERRTAVERPGPRFPPAELNQAMIGFRVDRTFLLRHGIQEYLFIKE